VRNLAELPKAHLHVHLESAIRPATLREIAETNGLPAPGPGPGMFGGFREFGDHNALIRDCLRRAEDFARIAAEFCADEAAAGARYVEVTFTAASHGERLGDPAMPLEAVLAGLARGQAEHDIECRVLLDHSRRRSVERLRATLELALDYQEVIGLGLAGEERYPLTPFAAVLDEAREAGLHLVHHAGEDGGPDSVREALDVGHSERLGHGIRVLDDPALVAEVRDRGVPLEVCPSSNVALGLVASPAGHPLPLLLAEGLTVTLNTDIPAVIGTDLAVEYARVRDTFDLSDVGLAQLARAGVDASFAPAETKRRLYAGIDAWLD
jgi:adenosine deaminase